MAVFGPCGCPDLTTLLSKHIQREWIKYLIKSELLPAGGLLKTGDSLFDIIRFKYTTASHTLQRSPRRHQRQELCLRPRLHIWSLDRPTANQPITIQDQDDILDLVEARLTNSGLNVIP